MKPLSSTCLISLRAALSLALASQAAFAGQPPSKCSSAKFPGPSNPSFETGNLDGWEILSGTAFGTNSVSSATTYWGGPFRQVGKYFLWGFASAGDTAVGQLRSNSFKASSHLSFLVGGGYDPVNLYIGLVRDSDGALLLNQTGMDDEALIRIIWDTSEWAGQSVHILAYDNSTASSWGHINLDDVRVGCDALADGTLTFNVLGQANQPVDQGQSECDLYAADPLRPQFHYSPYQGWINDPAGLIQWRGKHHLFSQFNPAAPLWGPMHWSHAQSTDGVHWRGLPVALYPPYPNNSQDTSGRFTGSAVYNSRNGGDLRLIFTDFTDITFHPDAVPEVVSTATSSDGIHFALYNKNPIIPNPPTDSTSGFRDPKAFWDPTDDTWKLVVGSGDPTSGKVQLYRSSDLLSWAYVGVLFEGNGDTGTMWECPNFFPLGNKWVLFYGGDSLGWYEVGTYNGSKFQSEKTGLLDAGPDSYAAQWYQDDSGRDLLITWMGNWPTSKWPSRVNGWAGQQSITRELFLRSDGGLGQKPIAELSSLASGNSVHMKNKRITETITLGSMKLARLQLTVDLISTTASSFSITTHSSGAEGTVVAYNIADRTLSLDTNFSGYGQQGVWTATIAKTGESTISLDIFIDRSSLEIFAADGTVMTATVWPRYEQSMDIKVNGTSGAVVFESILLTPLSSSWC